jgi:peptide/nickel transport system substrate-binding protein
MLFDPKALPVYSSPAVSVNEYDPRQREASAKDFTGWRSQMKLVRSAATHQVRRMRRRPLLYAGAAVTALALALTGCGASGSSPSTSSSATARSGGTFTILANSAFGVADPAQNYTLEEWQLLINTHDGLTQFARVAGVPGTKIVPDLATSIPTPTNGGKTYVFHIRRGIKFSNGQTLTPSAFVTTFERQFTVPGPTSFYSGIVGASACSTKGCNLSKGVVANDSAYTLTINLTAPDAELMDQLALPFAYAVPTNTPLKLTGNNVPPGTGPYMWKSYNPNTEAVLVRNPYFHVWNKEAQPAGYPNEIIEKYGLQVSNEVTEVENGEANEVFDGDQIPSDQLTQLNSAKYAGQVHVNTLTADWYMALNTKQPPFNNVKARQAINYAANRSAYVKIAGGPSLAVPACQILPPNFPSYKPYCPFTTGAQTVWSGPNLAKAKALVKASGTAGEHVIVDGTNDQVGTALVQQMISDLDSIGYKATPQLLSASIQYPYVQNSTNSTKWNVGWSAWYQDYPAPADFLNVLLGCGSIHPNSDASPNIAAFCDPSIQAQINKAEAEEATNPSAAAALWTQIDHEDTLQAPWVDLYNPKQIDFLSKNVHGYEWNPQWYILIDQLWLS